MSLYKLFASLIVDGKLRPAGAEVSLTGPQADWLDGIGVISKSGVPPKVAATVPAKPAIRKRCGACGH